jgi:hypothetical protein
MQAALHYRINEVHIESESQHERRFRFDKVLDHSDHVLGATVELAFPFRQIREHDHLHA